MFDLDWADPLLYDLGINADAIPLESGIRRVLDLRSAPEFQPTTACRARPGMVEVTSDVEVFRKPVR